MNAGQKSARRMVAGHVLSHDFTVCSSCLHRLRRQYATAAAAEQPPHHESPPPPHPSTQTGPRKAFRLLCSPVLSRPPQITRELTSFEKAFYLYQKRLNERLALPFTRYFYYKEGTPQDVEWKRKVKARRGVAARDIGPYNAYAEDAWNDEVPIGSRLGEPEDIVDKLVRDAEGKEVVNDAEVVGDSSDSVSATEGGETIAGNAQEGEGMRKPVGDLVIPRPAPRRTEADEKNDIKSLSRAMDRTLYLLVKGSDGEWRFPQDRVYGKENLHQAAERILLQSSGPNMNTWIVANHPVGHFVRHFLSSRGKPQGQVTSILPNKLVRTSKAPFEREELGVKTFFMKSRIMAGQADLAGNVYGDKDFAWLTKEEVMERVEMDYASSIRGMLAER